jgi:transcriptional regulator with XRE-family HTH domain
MTAGEVRELRERLGLSQSAFADLLGFSGRAATISEWERDVAPPSVSRAFVRERVAAVYGDAPAGTDRDRYMLSVLAMLEGDAESVRSIVQRQLAKLREARRVLLDAPARPDAARVESEARQGVQERDAAARGPQSRKRGVR